jgi:hypothetical protein
MWIFARAEILIRDGKGGKDRVTMLPRRLVEPLRDHLAVVHRQHQQDRVAGYGRVYLPDALARQ